MHKHWLERRSAQGKEVQSSNTLQIRTEYERDRARIIHSNSFRSLQHKTQLFNIEDSDKTHTRLTHTLEVSQISNGLLRFIQAKYDPARRNYSELDKLCKQSFREASQEDCELITQNLASDALMESICLTHDIGHSPFGHSGEDALCRLMYESGGFEGNAQTFRILTRLANYSKEFGLDLTRRALLGVIKYPHVFAEFPEGYNAEQLKQDKSFRVIKGIYQDDVEAFNWVLAPLSPEDRERFTRVEVINNRPRTLHKSFDCSIMELADNIAYAVHDLEDAVNIQVIEREDWDNLRSTFSKREQLEEAFALLVKHAFIKENFEDNLFSKDTIIRRKAYSDFVNSLTCHVEVRRKNEFSEPLLDLEAYICPEIYVIYEFFKELEYKIAICSLNIRGVNNRGCNIINRCFAEIKENVYLLGRSKDAYLQLPSQAQRDRFICDYIASMTNIELEDYYSRNIL
ncbi:hypothetical protein CKF54_03065 [Psittacicella hinzii]|uniref:HD domain-containing protein n=1 Tax=Psittacicella hinzii TaxID=2028575 RepID=A0A3A1Y6E6_9GAMM|nr:anti-phage deoxyguanosine triphosphatase [Psittacicella hinzii]RIY33185.1 hypothetical protein CKF54_03065 [Psittacicella hinzii]